MTFPVRYGLFGMESLGDRPLSMVQGTSLWSLSVGGWLLGGLCVVALCELCEVCVVCRVEIVLEVRCV